MEIKHTVGSLMKPGLQFLPADTKVLDACKVMTGLKIGAIMVGSNADLQGIFTERDLLTKVAAAGLSLENTTIGQVMTGNVLTINEHESPEKALRMMEELTLRHLPVTDAEGQGIGMLGIRDIMGFMVHHLEDENEALGKFLLEEISHDLEEVSALD